MKILVVDRKNGNEICYFESEHVPAVGDRIVFERKLVDSTINFLCVVDSRDWTPFNTGFNVIVKCSAEARKMKV